MAEKRIQPKAAGAESAEARPRQPASRRSGSQQGFPSGSEREEGRQEEALGPQTGSPNRPGSPGLFCFAIPRVGRSSPRVTTGTTSPLGSR